MRRPVAGSQVSVGPQVINGPPSRGHAFRCGIRSRAGASTTDWTGAFERIDKPRVAHPRKGPPSRPEVLDRRRIQAVEQRQELLADLAGVPSERDLDATHRAEQVRDELKVGAPDPLEKQGGPALPYDALRDFGDLEIGVHLDAHPGQLPAPLEVVDVAAQIGKETGALRRTSGIMLRLRHRSERGWCLRIIPLRGSVQQSPPGHETRSSRARRAHPAGHRRTGCPRGQSESCRRTQRASSCSLTAAEAAASPRNRSVARQLQQRGLATLLIDLLSEEEEAIDIETARSSFRHWPSSPAVSPARPTGRPRGPRRVRFESDTSGPRRARRPRSSPLPRARNRSGLWFPAAAGRTWPARRCPLVQAPTLLIVGGRDDQVIELNEEAIARLTCEKRMTIVPGASRPLRGARYPRHCRPPCRRLVPAAPHTVNKLGRGGQIQPTGPPGRPVCLTSILRK